MGTYVLLKPLAGWYSSHWNFAARGLPSRPFTVTSASQGSQQLLELQDLYTRASFLLGLIGRNSGRTAPLTARPADQTSLAEGVVEDSPATLVGGAPLSRGPFSAQPPEDATTRKFHHKSLPLKAFPKDDSRLREPSSYVEHAHDSKEAPPAISPMEFNQVAARAEALIEAVNALGASLAAHEFLDRSLRDYGSALISKFAQALSPYGLNNSSIPLRLDREQLAKAYQENPQQVLGGFWGEDSLTPEVSSLADAILGAPGAYLMEPALINTDTYQPFRPANPWFRVAPALFWQVA